MGGGGGGGPPGGVSGGEKPRSPDKPEIRTYKLKNNNAEALVAALTKVLFESGERSGRVIAVGNNHILASASADTLREIEDIIQKLADAPSAK